MFCRGRLSLVFSLIMLIPILSQRPLKIGEPLGESFWNKPLEVVNYSGKTLSLKEDKDKLILLDFWNTWCSGCLLNFPKMETLEKQFKGKLKVLAVSNQDRVTLEKFFSGKNGQRYKGVVSVTGDKMLHQLFPHVGVPYIVWIKDGKVINTTDAGQVNENTVGEVLKGETSSLQTVIQIGRERPLMLSENFSLEKGTHLMHYAFFSKGRIRAIAYGSGFHREGRTIYGRQFTNFSLMEIYKGIAYELFQQRKELFSQKRILNEVKNPETLDFDTKKEDPVTDSKLYNYEYIVPLSRTDSLYGDMLQGLNQFSGYTATIAKRPVQCLVLKRTSTKDKIASKGGAVTDQFLQTPSVLKNTTLDYMLSGLNANSEITPLLVIDDTGYKGKVDLKFSNVHDLKVLQKELLRYDLELKEETREVYMLVIEDKVSPLQKR